MSVVGSARNLRRVTDVPSVYDWIGGTAAVGRWLDVFHDHVERDELLVPVFGGVVTREHRDHVTAWWSEVWRTGHLSNGP